MRSINPLKSITPNLCSLEELNKDYFRSKDIKDCKKILGSNISKRKNKTNKTSAKETSIDYLCPEGLIYCSKIN